MLEHDVRVRMTLLGDHTVKLISFARDTPYF